MQIVITCLVGIAVLVSPCAYDTDPREPPVAAMIASAAVPDTLQMAAASAGFPDGSGELVLTHTRMGTAASAHLNQVEDIQ